MKNHKISFPGTTIIETRISEVVGGYKGKGNYEIIARPGTWYIRAASGGWGYIATRVEEGEKQ